VVYGTTFGSYHDVMGSIFAVEPPAAAGGDWTFSVLHKFAGGSGQIQGGLFVGSGGIIYGTTSVGGVPSSNCGTVFQLTP
jgi:uncharacterized repeat protein (TIGR03803 family)